MTIKNRIDHLIKTFSTPVRFLKQPVLSGLKVLHLMFIILIPVASAQEAPPVVINLQTQQPVELIRAYWNANVDIANRPVACDRFEFNFESNVYEATAPSGQRNVTYTHAPLTRGATGFTRSNIVEAGYPGEYQGLSFWTVRDGIYSGVAVDRNYRIAADFDEVEYLELVSYDTINKAITTGSSNAIRAWHNTGNQLRSSHSVCYALDDRPFIPTGSAEISNSNLPTIDELNDFTFQFPQPVDADTDLPIIIRGDTGEQVKFSRGEWAYNEQLVSGSLYCSAYQWKESYQSYTQVPEFGYYVWPRRWFSQSFTPYFDDGMISTNIYWETDLGRYQEPARIPVDSFQLFGGNPYIELTDYGFNLWDPQLSYFQYQRCQFPAPKRVLSLQPDNCDYSTADQFDGYGWNPVTQDSCSPLETPVTETPADDQPPTVEQPSQSGCDYTNAHLNDGWGWNSDLAESCSPLTNIDNGADNDCDYANASQFGGWGWNPETQESCAPLTDPTSNISTNTSSSNCDYSNADAFGGWGWNAVTRESCAPVATSNEVSGDTQPNSCVDSDGDGWGWNGVSSCQVSAGDTRTGNNNSGDNPACIDTDGDGWGWNSATSTSCRP